MLLQHQSCLSTHKCSRVKRCVLLAAAHLHTAMVLVGPVYEKG